ncbi:protein of unknown function [Arenibacter palladensis]|uniref:DUF4271 domain-containing protein n=1 Tax=Arenibacter palladensis TaxID=237373 RepID=A0A1M4VG10_9FLAO|nr:DUF4271 domain-containing protein [Arenibacter palladensis]SHE67868.1 protein of unknown function [Arenibacter palladensis]|tara:strand:- start:1003 stop:1668 length:666 start_codon:yes stop_codon:yes gene_type:complete
MEAILRNEYNVDWITIILFSSIFFMVLAKTSFYSRFLNYIILPFNNKYIFLYQKKDKLFNWFSIFFSIFQLLNFSLFLYFAYTVFFKIPEGQQFVTYGIIFISLLLFFTIKILLQLGNGFIFNINKTISEIIFKKLSYLNYSGIVMLFANLLLNYVFKESKAVIFISLLLVFLINAIGWTTTLRNHQKFIASNFVYFILYLCALEIAPIIIVGNYLIDRNL